MTPKSEMLSRMLEFAMDADFYSCLESKEEAILVSEILTENGIQNRICQEDIDSWD